MSKEGLQKVVDKEQSTDAKAQVCVTDTTLEIQQSATSFVLLTVLVLNLVSDNFCNQFMQMNMLSTDDLRDLFTLREDVR